MPVYSGAQHEHGESLHNTNDALNYPDLEGLVGREQRLHLGHALKSSGPQQPCELHDGKQIAESPPRQQRLLQHLSEQCRAPNLF